MSLPADQVLISADDHLDIHAMPPDAWSSRLPKEWRERGPHVEETPEGPYWFCDGQRVSPSGRKETGYIAAHDHGFRPGQPQTRLEDMDRDGVRAHGRLRPDLHPAPDQRRRAARAGRARLQRLGGRVPARGTRSPGAAARHPFVRSAGRRSGSSSAARSWATRVRSSAARWAAASRSSMTSGRISGTPRRRSAFRSTRTSSGGLHSLTMKLGSWRMPAAVAVVPMQLGRDARGIDLLGHPREAPARQVRDGRGGPRLDSVRDRAPRPRAAQVRLEDPATTRSRCCPARSSRGRCSPPTRTRSSASS